MEQDPDDAVLGLQTNYVASMKTCRVPYTITRCGLELVILPWTFPPYLDSELLTATMHVTEAESVLDVGTGCGIVALVAAKTSAHVVATDINPAAIENTRLNAERLGLTDRIDVYETDLFPPHERCPFDVITFNPPYSDHAASDVAEHSVWDPGHAAMKRFFENSPQVLRPGGRLYVTWAGFADFGVFEGMASAHGGRFARIAETRDEVSLFAVYEVTFDAG